MTDSSVQNRGLSTMAGMLIFLIMGSVLTAGGAYLMFQLGNQDIGQTATTVFEARQSGEVVIIQRTAGESVKSENLHVVGGRVREMPTVIGSGGKIIVEPTHEEVKLLFEKGRVTQVLARTTVDLTQLLVTVNSSDGAPVARHPVGVYELGENSTVQSREELLSTIERTGTPPRPAFVGSTDGNGTFTTATTTRKALARNHTYAVLTATRGPDGQRTYLVETVTIRQGQNRVTFRLPES